MTRRWFCRLEWKPQDCWIGVFWKRGHHVFTDEHLTLDVWVCVLPMLPIHFGYAPRTA